MRGNRFISPSASIWPWWFVGLAAVRRHRHRASPRRSSPLWLDLLWHDLAGASAPFSVPAVVSSLPRRLDGVCNPDIFSRCGAVLGRLAVSTVLLRRRRSPLDGGLAATTLAAPTVSLPWSPYSSSASSSVSLPPTPLSLCSCLSGLASEPGMLAYCCYPVLDLVSRPCTSYVGLCMLLLLIFRTCFS
jgi:hypothetical protein